ncbi:MAG: hypothetical protein AAFU55_11120 [Pseudomonadota bacterium]
METVQTTPPYDIARFSSSVRDCPSRSRCSALLAQSALASVMERRSAATAGAAENAVCFVKARFAHAMLSRIAATPEGEGPRRGCEKKCPLRAPKASGPEAKSSLN